MARRRCAVTGIVLVVACGAALLVRSSYQRATADRISWSGPPALPEWTDREIRPTGVAEAPSERLRRLRRYADHGDAVAQAYLANMYRRGDGVPRDRIQAIRWEAAVVLSSIRMRTDWMLVSALLFMVGGVIISVPRWKLPAWLTYALLAAGSGFFALHVLWIPRWTCGNRTVTVAIFSTFCLACTVIAAGVGTEEGAGQRAGR